MTAHAQPLPKYLRKPAPVRRVNGHGGAAPGSADPYARAAFVGELADLAKAPEGERNDQLNTAGFNLAQLVASGHLGRDETWNALYSTALSIGLEPGESANTLRSAFAAGEAEPRDVPEQEQAPEVTSLGPIPRDGGQDAQRGGLDGLGEEGEGDEPLNLRARFPALDWHELWADDTEEEWIVEPILPARRLVALFSPPKVGKSLLMLELAVGIARGISVLGSPPPKRARRVLYVDHENDPRGDVRTRLQAMGVEPDQLDGLVYLSYPQMAYLDTWTGGAELLAVAQEYGCEVVVIDTISRAVAGEENDNDTWLSFYRNTGKLLKSEGIAVVRLDHTGKDLTKGMRGGSAKYGDVDLAWSMTMPVEDQLLLECVANRLPVPEKRLTLARRSNPLRHEAQDGSAAWRQDQEGAARIADALGLEPAAGFPTLSEEFRQLGLYAPDRGKGRFSKALLESLPRYRVGRPPSVRVEESLDDLLKGLS